jgi:hypothetical protein
MWSLGKVTGTPEVKRVYISSFFDREFQVRAAQHDESQLHGVSQCVFYFWRFSNISPPTPPPDFIARRIKTMPHSLPRSATIF